MIVADSDVLIDYLRRREPASGRIARELASGALATTAISIFEIMTGIRGPKERAAVEALFAALAVLPFDAAAATAAADLRRNLEQHGRAIGLADYQIAGICISRSATLLTRNRGHFERVPGLALATL